MKKNVSMHYLEPEVFGAGRIEFVIWPTGNVAVDQIIDDQFHRSDLSLSQVKDLVATMRA